MKKYDFTGKTKIVNGIELKQIVRLDDNLIGGWIEKEENLSQEGDCFIYDNAKVYNNARIYNNAKVFDNARIYDDAKVFDNAAIFGDAEICNYAKIYGGAYISHGSIIGEVQIKYDDVCFYKSANTRLVTAITKDDKTLFNVGCQKLISKEEFIDRIYNKGGGLKANPHREFYLKILDLY